MRSAAATYDDDFDAPDVPAKGKAPKKTAARAGAGKKKSKPQRFGFDMTKVARIAAIGMSATIVVGIMVNALLMQKGHHPAPLFGASIALGGAAAPAHVAAARPETATAAPTPAAEPDAAPVPRPLATVPRRAAQDTESGDDPIGRLLQTGVVPTANKAAGAGAGKSVSGVQRALAKLGYDVKPNGAMGPATRKAIEAFEKDRHLPVNGEMSRRLVKVLVAESGMKID